MNHDCNRPPPPTGGEVWAGSQETPEFRAWLEDMERRFGPVTIGGGLGGPIDCHVGGRKFVGKLPSPEYTARRERQHRLLGPIGNIPPAEAEANHYAARENLNMAA